MKRSIVHCAWVAVAGASLVWAACKPATCSVNEDCGAGAYCREDGLCEQGAAPLGSGSSGGAGSSAGSSSSSGSGGASTSSTSSSSNGGVPACPDGCDDGADGGRVRSWACVDGGAGTSACRPVECQAGFDTCNNGGACQTSLMTDPLHCGGCNAPVVPEGNRCLNGLTVCGQSSLACVGGFCTPNVDGGFACAQCVQDNNCPMEAPVCCAGSCVTASAGCGCAPVPGSPRPTPCSANQLGGGCVLPDGGLVATEDSLAPGRSAAEVHQGRCGCTPANGQALTDTDQCVSHGGFYDLCVASDGGSRCAPQNNPPGTASSPAGNCGLVGEVCGAQKGGLICLSDMMGVGQCGCTPDATGNSGCQVAVVGPDQRPHTIADRCNGTNGVCSCGGGTACPFDGALPDCCASGCFDMRTSPVHCGSCGNNVANHAGANQCVNGTPVCGTTGAECTGLNGRCVWAGDGGRTCAQCDADNQCPGSTPVCCRGQCVGVDRACGCGSAIGATAGRTCSAANEGGACVTIGTGTPLTIAGVLQGAPPASAFHNALCGCTPANGLPMTNVNQCFTFFSFNDVCAPSGTAGVGNCVQQNEPPARTDFDFFLTLDVIRPAENCGEYGHTCNLTGANLGFECVNNGGTGECLCTQDAGQLCGDYAEYAPDRYSRPADTCSGSTCVCGGSASCDPSTQNCCAGVCTSKNTNGNCGYCGISCAGGFTCTNAKCTCGIAADCSGISRAKDCVGGACVCSGWNNQVCPPNKACCGVLGCCDSCGGGMAPAQGCQTRP